jgi:hypothetical protein
MTTANLVNSDLTRSIPYSSYSMNFDGSSDYIEVSSGNSFDFGTNDFAISSWVNTTGTTSQHRTIACKQNPSNAGNWSLQILTNGKPNFYANNGSIDLNSASTVNDGNWHNIILKRTSDVFELIVDNVIKDTQTVSSQNLTNTENLRIGHRVTAYNAFFSGSLSNVAIWNSELTQDQILTIYNGGVPNNISSLSPVSWWSLAGDSYYNGNDWICPDLGSGGNNGTSDGMGGTELVGNGPGSTANGIATGMNIPANLQGNAPNSTKNAFSINMAADDKTSSVPDISS